MRLTGTELIRVAELITLGAETAKAFSDTTADGQASRIVELAALIEAAAHELAEIGREMEGKSASAN